MKSSTRSVRAALGEAYRARDPRLGRDVAIKVLPNALSAELDRLRRFEQEARAAAALNHPNIIAVYDIGVHEGAPFIVMELLEGSTLRERLTDSGLPVRRATEYAVQTARGLAAAHDKGIVHRDLKPENLFVTSDGRVKILDFGLAKLTEAAPALAGVSQVPTFSPPTIPGVVLGTVGYMAPEQVRGEPADHRADIFALGTILYEMLAGRRAFHAATTAETMTAILKEEPPELPADRLPSALARIVKCCLEKHPTARFQTATDLAFALEALSLSATSDEAAIRGHAASHMQARGTEGATFPFWAPDGNAVGFFADGKLKRVDVAGGTPQVLADAPNGRGGVECPVSHFVHARQPCVSARRRPHEHPCKRWDSPAGYAFCAGRWHSPVATISPRRTSVHLLQHAGTS